VNVGDNKGVTPLMSAVRGGWPDILRLLLAAHADVNACDKQGVTPLSLARREGQREVVQLLKEAAARR
jgi:ankyrin repeat protein